MKRGPAFFFVLGCLLTAGAQNNADFDDLSRRAEAALDTHPEEATVLYRKALAIRPDWAEGWLYMGASLFQTRHYAEARDALRKGVALEPGKGTPLAFLGMAEYELGDYRQALSDILTGESIGLADKPGFAAAVRYRGALIGLRFSDFVLALDQLRPLVKAGNKSPALIEALGLSALCMNTLPTTLPAAKRPLVELAGRATWAFVAEKPDEAEPLFKELETLFPDEPGVHYMCGAWLLNRDPAAAEAEFRKELQIAPSNVSAHEQLALLLLNPNDAEGAVKEAAEAVRLAPKEAFAQVTLGRALMDANRIPEAIATLQTAEKLAPRAPKVHFYLAQAYRKAGKTAEAGKEKAEWYRLQAAQEEPASDR